MSLILNIDTATEKAHVSIAENGVVLNVLFNEEQKKHGSFLQPAIKKIAQQAGLTLPQLDAIAVTAGPGSYTGLRIGIASAKGLCFALNKPLIAIDTLEAMACSATIKFKQAAGPTLLCPMIDARRMEVFAAIFNMSLQPALSPGAYTLQKGSFEIFLNSRPVVFFGSGSAKWQNICGNKNASFSEVEFIAEGLSQLSGKKLEEKNFTDLAYFQPVYLKEFV